MIAVEAFTFICPRCNFPITEEPSGSEGVVCRRCDAHLKPAIFPALLRGQEIHAYQPAVAGESTCFFHADRVAVFACARCGRFLCPLCRIEWVNEDVCPSCLEATNTGNQADQLVSSRFHFDSLALVLSTVPLLSGFLSMVTAPIALGYALFTFRKPCSIVPRSKIRFLLAILFSAATIVSWTVFFIYISRRSAGPQPEFP